MKVVKPFFLFGDTIVADDFIVATEEHRWLQGVDSRMMLLASMVRCYSICDFIYESITCIMGEAISVFLGGVAFGFIDCQEVALRRWVGKLWGCISANMA